MADSKKAPPSLKEYLDNLATGLDDRIAEAESLVEAKRAELEGAERDLRTLKALKGVSEGTLKLGGEVTARRQSGGGVRAPRSEGATIREKIKVVLKDGPKPVAKIIEEVRPTEGQRVRNSLALLVKNKEIANKSGVYSLR